jgi:uncharacterized protein DUF5615
VKLLLDGHIKKAASPALQRLCPGCETAHISDWHGGLLRTSEDEDILVACFEENRVLVTYDQRTIPGLLRRWAAEERSHAGVIFGDNDSVPPSDPGAVAAALSALIKEVTGSDMTNVVRYLRRR